MAPNNQPVERTKDFEDVLVIEDDVELREALAELLEQEGYRVAQASEGREALAHLRAGHRPRLILLDLIMPGMDGWQFCAEQARDPELAEIPVAILSATGQPPHVPYRRRAAGFFRKPANISALLASVRAYCKD